MKTYKVKLTIELDKTVKYIILLRQALRVITKRDEYGEYSMSPIIANEDDAEMLLTVSCRDKESLLILLSFITIEIPRWMNMTTQEKKEEVAKQLAIMNTLKDITKSLNEKLYPIKNGCKPEDFYESVKKHDDKMTIAFQKQEIDRLRESNHETIMILANKLTCKPSLESILEHINMIREARDSAIDSIAKILGCDADVASIKESINSLMNKSYDNISSENSKVLNDMTKPDMVNHPPHYGKGHRGKECIEIAELLPYNLGCVIKYIWRYQDKENPLQDLEKALWYLNRHMLPENQTIASYSARMLSTDDINKLIINADESAGDNLIVKLLNAFKTHRSAGSKVYYGQSKNKLERIIHHERIKAGKES